MTPRNLLMAQRTEATPVRYPLSFVVVGDSGAWPAPTADAIFSKLLDQAGCLRPSPTSSRSPLPAMSASC